MKNGCGIAKKASEWDGMPDRKPLEVVIVLVNDGHGSTAVGPMEVFSSAGRLWNEFSGMTPQSRFRVTTASIDGAPVETAFGLRIASDLAIEDVARADLIFVPASGALPSETMQRHAALLPWLSGWHSRGSMLATVCSGAAFLAEAGLLDGRRATTHWGVAEAFQQRYPKVDWRTDLLITEDDRIFCGGGVHAATDLSMFLVERLCGREVAIECAKALILHMPRTHQTGYAITQIGRSHGDAKVRALEEQLHARYRDDLSLDEMAREAGMSRRTLTRRFKAATGCLPGHYLQLIRVAVARQMLEQGARSVQEVGVAVGYDDVGFFRSVFKRHSGLTPAAYRERYRPQASSDTA
jgi:transcriptional regulator GlxA family with amidase domain